MEEVLQVNIAKKEYNEFLIGLFFKIIFFISIFANRFLVGFPL